MTEKEGLGAGEFGRIRRSGWFRRAELGQMTTVSVGVEKKKRIRCATTVEFT